MNVPSNSAWRATLPALAIVALAAAAYAPALGAGFVFDDHVLVERSALLAGPLWRIWFTTDAFDYWPLSYTSFWVEWRLWGAWPPGYHAVNVALHAATAVLLWRALRRLRVPGAWLAALLFTVHPVAVESVAWISERKNVLSAALFVATILVYAAWRAEGGRARYAGALALFLLALLAKTSTVVLPVVLLGIAAAQGGVRRRDLRALAPFALLSAVFSGVTLWFQWVRAMSATSSGTTLAERIGGAAWALVLYLRTAFVPVRLAFVYPPWPVGSAWFFLPLAAVILAAVVLWRSRSGRARPVALALGYHAVVVLPVLGIVDMAYFMFGPASNHLQYLALFGPVALVAWAVTRLASSGGARLRAAALASAAAVVLALGAGTARRAAAFESDVTLWRAAVEWAPQSLVAAMLLAEQLGEEGKRAEALAVLASAAERMRSPADRHRARAMLLLQLRQVDEAVLEARAASALRVDPAFDVDLGKMLVQARRYPEAVELLAPLVAREPRSPHYRTALATALVGAGRAAEAADVAREACRVAPSDAGACATFADALARAGRGRDVRAELAAAMGAPPRDPAVEVVLREAGLAGAP